MKPLFTFLLIFACLFTKAQYTPETAIKLTCDNVNNSNPLAGVAAITGPNYDCLTALSNTNWCYFTMCDSGYVEINIDINTPDDTLGYVLYGPLTDTINIS